MNPEILTHLLQEYNTIVYPLLFLILIGEGPFVSFFASGIAAQGFLDIGLLAFIAYIADIVGDVFWFGVGYFGISKIFHRWYQKHKTTTSDQSFFIKKYRRLPLMSFLFFIKITPYLAIPGLLFLGSQQISRKKFLFYTIPLCIFIRSIFLIIGYFGGNQIENMQTILQGWKYVGVAIAIFFLLFLITKKLYIFFIKKIRKKIEQKIKKK